MISMETKMALPLTPLIFWSQVQTGSGSRLYVFDIEREKGGCFGYKGIEETQELRVTGDNEYSSIHQQLLLMRDVDQEVRMIEGVSLNAKE